VGVLSDFEREQIIDALLAGASVMKTAKLLSRATVFKVMSAYTNYGKTTSAKRNRSNTDRKTSSYIEKDCLKKNHRTTAAQVTAELSIHLEDLVSTKNSLT
jgi:hypothetical protein